MDFFTSINTALSLINNASDLLKKGAKPEDVLNCLKEAHSHLQHTTKAYVELAQKNMDLQNKLTELQDKIREYEDWEKTASCYELFKLNSGNFVYRLKPSEQEIPHYVCAKCFNERKRYILQGDNVIIRPIKTYRCPGCGDTVVDR